MSETKKELTLNEILEKRNNDLIDKFKQYNTPEFLKMDSAERNDIVLAKFDEVKNEIESRIYPLVGDALKGVRNLTFNYFNQFHKPVTDLDKFMSLCTVLSKIDDDSQLNLTKEQVQYIGDMWTKITFTTVESGLELEKIKSDMENLFHPLLLDEMELKYLGGVVENLRASWLMVGTDKEEEVIVG